MIIRASTALRQAAFVAVVALTTATLPASAATPGPSGPGPATESTIAASLDALRTLPSYRFSWDTLSRSGQAMGTRGTVVAGDEWSARTDTSVDGETFTSAVAIGDQGWLSYGGSGFITSNTAPLSPDWLPFEATIRELLAGGPVVTDLGTDETDGVSTRHVRATVDQPDPAPSENGSYSGLQATLDSWIAVDDGHLVRAEIEGTRAGVASYSADIVSEPVNETLVVSHLSDTSNRVDVPEGPLAAPSVAPGDPAVVSLVDTAYSSLADLDSYRIAIQANTSGVVITMDTVIQNRPQQAAQLTMESGEQFAIRTLVVGDQVFTRETADGPWQTTAEGGGASCSSATGAMEPCTFESIEGISTNSKVPTGSFIRLDDETLDGVAVAHLRSTAGVTVPMYGWIPGTTDLWIALADGQLVREDFDGLGQTTTMVVSHVNDPANLLTAPDEGS